MTLATTNITLKLTSEHKNKLEKAAAIRCMTLDEYLLALTLDAATENTLTPESITVSETDWQIITQAIQNPPRPNETLRAAIEQHQQDYGQWNLSKKEDKMRSQC